MLSTTRLVLRAFSEDDFQDLYEYCSREDVARYLYWHLMSEGEAQVALEKKISQQSMNAEGDILSLAVCLEQKVIGDLSLIFRSAQHKQCEIGFVFNPAFGGQGYATEAAEAGLKHAFNVRDFHRVYGRCDARNTGSWKLMERLGMRREAHFKGNEIFKGGWSDEYCYAILRDEIH